MCDSITILVLLQEQSQKEYDSCNFPTRGRKDADKASSDFRHQYAKSPLTNAGFMITPLGAKLASSRDVGPIQNNRMLYGRVAGYMVDFNPPACTVGHNRLLVNGVYAAAKVGLELLKNWLATNGCKREGLDAASIEDVFLLSVSPTFLFSSSDEHEARLDLAQWRGRSEVVCNKKNTEGKTKPPAFSVPPIPPKQGHYIYTSYIRLREYVIDCYVKVFGAKGSFYIPIPDGAVEFEVGNLSKRTLRIGTKLNGKWLKDRGLEKATSWLENGAAYEQAFALVRSALRLDEPLRTKQMRSSSVAALNLPEIDLTLLRFHLGRNEAREHPMFRQLSAEKASKRYSASRLRILDRTKIDLDIAYDLQLKGLFPDLSKRLIFPGEYKPAPHIAEFIFSRTSVPIALQKLRRLTEDALQGVTVRLDELSSGNSKTTRPHLTVDNASRRLGRGVSNVPIDSTALD